ncbi:MAG: hypothetical protein IH944_12190 [Armatimonadetes bacterium]|nr:hypothetical protein [Armatimonadota bacterium]
MNETTFEHALKSAMEPITERPALDEKIDAKLKRATTSVKARRWGATLGAAAAVVLSVFIFPRAQAQPTLAQVAGALDDVKSVRMESFAILEDGSRISQGTIAYYEGRWRLTTGNEDSVWFDGGLYRLDTAAGRYVRSSMPSGPFSHNTKGLGLSSMLSSGGMNSKEVTLTDGKFRGADVKIATVDSTGLRERMLIFADARTLLPISVEHYSNEQDVWRLRGEMTFDYSPNFPKGHFFLKPGVPVISKDDDKSDLFRELAATELATIDIKGGRLVVRSVDVARDGTVFVTYQVGDKTRSWRGYRLTVTDDIGTVYAPSSSLLSFDDDLTQQSPDGRIEREVLVQLVPDKAWRKRTVKVSMRFTDAREPVLFVGGVSSRPDGTIGFHYMPNTLGVDVAALPPLEEIWNGVFDEPSCEWRPDIFAQIQYSEFSHDMKAQLFRATSLARYYENSEDWKQAEHWIEEELRLMREHEEQGFGPYSLDDAHRRLDAVRQILSRPRSRE